MSEKVLKGSIRHKAKALVTKTTLNSPYNKIWTHVAGDDMQFILETLKKKFKQLELKKIETHPSSSKRKKSRTSKPPEGNNNNPVKEEGDTIMKTPKKDPPKPGWTVVDLRKQIVIGINEVTRALERNELSLVIVCKSAKPEMITKHIIELSYSREVPACQLPRLSENMAAVLGLSSVLALGFKKTAEVFYDEIKAIVPRVPPLQVPWLPIGGEIPKNFFITEEEEDNDGGDDPEKMDTVDPSTSSKKRKLSTTVQLAPVPLQSLKVKKIVPNPKKKRKVKVKKSKTKNPSTPLPKK